ncbi:MAG: HEAT repeat domain-containing protein [Gemmatimonadota bacterium]|nr:HEAT repeat domain-containing protein [Gemmatimonadota bacterium]
MSTANPPSALVVEISKGFTLSEFYPLTHPTLGQALEKIERDLLALGAPLSVEVGPRGLRMGREWVGWRSSHVSRLATRLREHEVCTLEMHPEETHADDVGRFLSAAALPPRVVRAAGGFVAALMAADIHGVRVNGVATDAVPAEPSTLTRTGVNFDVALWSPQQIYELVRQTSVRVELEDLEKLREELLSAEESQRVEIIERMRQTALWTVEQGRLETVVQLVVQMCGDAADLVRRNPARRGAVMLALQKIASRSVIEALVVTLGKARSEGERSELQSVLLHIGADVVTPLVRALTDSSDLSARRAYRDALVVLDQVGIPLLEDMIGDERWFVVRNMVNILGEIRSADSVEHFARTIRHTDARVRRETVLALNKLGGEESVPLLVKGLADPDPGIRGAAALGLGLSRVAAAVSPLLTRLAQEEDAEADGEILRALGRLGDPRAVPALAERAQGGGWLSRRPIAGRIEAIRVLGQIGGEHAEKALGRLERERVLEVRDAAARALRGEG